MSTMRAPGRAVLQTLFILLCAGLGTAWTYHFHPKRPTLYLAPERALSAEVALTEVLSWDEPPVWIDARSGTEYAAGHIPGAISLHPGNALGQIQKHFELFIDHRKRFVIYGPETAAETIAERLRGIGLDKVDILAGGFEAWQAHHS